MRVSRLAHSLGAMHLASRYTDIRAQLRRGFNAVVTRHAQLGLGSRRVYRSDLPEYERVTVMLVE
jgi:hypothetical protein